MIPALRDSFTSETEALTRQLLAAALVRLGDTDPEYFGHVAAAAMKAVAKEPKKSLGGPEVLPRHRIFSQVTEGAAKKVVRCAQERILFEQRA